MSYRISPNGSASGCFSHYAVLGRHNDFNLHYFRPENRLCLGKHGKENLLYDARMSYDLNGNRLKKEHFKNGIVDAVEAYCYNERNELTQKSDVSGLVSYLYDANGNLLSERTKKEASEYRYDLLNRQTCVHITDSQENVENSYRYDAFGNVLESREIIQNRMLYTGQQYDQATGQYYLRARYYNPVMGRFTQEDTYRGDELNLYAYCANNPVVYYDPSGHNLNDCAKDKKKKPDQAPNQGVGEVDRNSISLPEYDGKTTQGVLVLDDGSQISFSSGNADPNYKNYIPASHVEGKAAIYMRENGITNGVVYHNNTNGTCPYCDKMLSTLLEEGSNLTVVPPSNASAVKSGWIDIIKTYVGNNKVPKNPK